MAITSDSPAHVGIDSAGAGNLVAARRVSISLDVLVDRRTLIPAGARIPGGADLVTGDDSAPPTIHGQVEESGTTFDLAALRRLDQMLAGLIQQQQHHPRCHVIPPGLAADRSRTEFLHSV